MIYFNIFLSLSCLFSSYFLACFLFTFLLIFFLLSYSSSSYFLTCLLLTFLLAVSPRRLVMGTHRRLYTQMNTCQNVENMYKNMQNRDEHAHESLYL